MWEDERGVMVVYDFEDFVTESVTPATFAQPAPTLAVAIVNGLV